MTGSNEALADAMSGVVGTLVSLWCFYPIERIKTNLQAGKPLSSSSSSSSGWLSTAETSEKDFDRVQRQLKIILDLIRQTFRGCLTKSIHATSSSFCYFYFYSWILSFYNNKRRRRLQSGNSNSSESVLELVALRPSTRLVLSAIAAMMNTFVTLPLDVLSSKRTVVSDNDDKNKGIDTRTAPEYSNTEDDRKSIMEKTWNSIEKNGGKSLPGLTASTCTSSSSSSSSSSTIEMVFHEACSRSEELFALQDENEDQENDNNTSINSSNSISSSTSILSNNDEYKLRWKERQEQLKSRRLHRKRQLQHNTIRDENTTGTISDAINNSSITKNTTATTTNNITICIRRWSKLWKGLAPALLLCSNPSIHYTVFDMLKTKTLAWKRHRNRRGVQQRQLLVSEAFVLGLISKFVATIVTYPLIRAKVLMMVGGDLANQDSGDQSNVAMKASSQTLWSVLKDSYYRDGGISGLYKGCDWQLIHTLLKSALMMAIREQITDSSRALFGVSSK